MADWSIEGKAALLVVHMQKSICMVGGSLAQIGHCQAVRETQVINNIQALQSSTLIWPNRRSVQLSLPASPLAWPSRTTPSVSPTASTA